MPNQPQQWQYIFVTVTNSGETHILNPDAGKGVALDKHILVTLNSLGQEGWELVQGNVNPDSSGLTYIMKRPAPQAVQDAGIV
jgi:hypothetical protein